MHAIIDAMDRTYTSATYAVTLFSGLLSIMLERYLFMRRGYKREAAINAFFGWIYVVGGTLLYLTLWLMKRWV